MKSLLLAKAAAVFHELSTRFLRAELLMNQMLTIYDDLQAATPPKP